MKKWMYGLIPIPILAMAAVLIYTGAIQLNQPSASAYPVRGVDVSHYQGNIDWDQLKAQGIQFAYIKATEGSSHQDSAFASNWEHVQAASLRPGAYHFFSFESSGLTQSENYIRTVPALDNMLPPVIDIEPYGQYKSIKDSDAAVSEIRDWLHAVEAEYGMRLVIYTTEPFYYDCIATQFPEYDIWIRSVYRSPFDAVQWTFWQYSNRARLNGYDGEERFIDMNAFHGTKDDFAQYPR